MVHNMFSSFNSFTAFFIAILITKYRINAGIAIHIGSKIKLANKFLIIKTPPALKFFAHNDTTGYEI